MHPQLLWTLSAAWYLMTWWHRLGHCPKSFMEVGPFEELQSLLITSPFGASFFNLPPGLSLPLQSGHGLCPLRILLQETTHSFLNKLCALSHLAAHVVFSPSLPLLFQAKTLMFPGSGDSVINSFVKISQTFFLFSHRKQVLKAFCLRSWVKWLQYTIVFVAASWIRLGASRGQVIMIYSFLGLVPL